MTDTGFDASVLSEFRARLVDADAAQQLLERLLAARITGRPALERICRLC